MNRYYNPVRTVEGPGCLSQLPQVLEEMTLPQRKVLVLAWSQQALEHPAVAALLGKESGMEAKSLVFTASNPTVATRKGERRGSKKSGVYGLQPHRGAAVSGVAGDNDFCPRGGGSHWGRQCAGCRQVPVLLVRSGVGKSPGIAGGHHRWKITPRRPVDRRAHHSGHRKRGHLLGHNLGPGAKLQALLAQGMPVQLAVSSALDAAAHAVESYWANHTNAVSRGLALEAIVTVS